MMYRESRNWKWMAPAALIPVMIVIWNWMMEKGWVDFAMIPLGVAAVLLVATIMNGALYIYEHFSDIFVTVQEARNSTPEVRMFEAAKGMHPDAIKSLLVHRRSIWRIKYVPHKDVVDWIFDEIPSVHAGFVDFVLDHSTDDALMPKRLLSEGSKQFDPEEIVTDYQQYDDLIFYLQYKLMCTEAFGNQPPKWMQPWNRDLVRHRFGLDGTPYEVEENISEAMKAVIRAQAKNGTGNGASSKSVNPAIAKALSDLEQTEHMKANQS